MAEEEVLIDPLTKKQWLKKIYNKCRCGKITDSIVLGETKRGKDSFIKIVSSNCSDCGLKITGNIKSNK